MGHLSFSFVDVLVVLVVLASVIYATYRGFVQETLTIFAWAAAAFATLYFGPALAPFLRERISPEWLGTLVAYGGIFLVVLIPLSFVSFRFAQGVQRSPVGAIDRALGFAFGIHPRARDSWDRLSGVLHGCADSLATGMDDERAVPAAHPGFQRRVAVADPRSAYPDRTRRAGGCAARNACPQARPAAGATWSAARTKGLWRR